LPLGGLLFGGTGELAEKPLLMRIRLRRRDLAV
jgi:hypothetical protein